VTTGARSVTKTVTTVTAEPLSAFEAVVVRLIVVDPWLAGGVQAKVPAVNEAFVVNVAPEGSGAAVSELIGSPSGSEARTVNVIRVFGAPDALAGAVTTGGWSASASRGATIRKNVKGRRMAGIPRRRMNTSTPRSGMSRAVG
jgi:hypothetical protein